MRLELAVTRSAWERNDVADIGHTSHEQHKALEAESETRVRHSAETASVKIPPHILHRDVEFLDALAQLLIALLTLRTTDNLSDFREQQSMARTVLPSSFCFI